MTTMLMMGLLAAFGVFLAGGLFFVTADLLRRGCPADSVKKVLGGNWIRFLTEILK